MRSTVSSVAVLLMAVATHALADDSHEVKKSPLDHVILYEFSISKETPVRIREFPTDNADLGTGANPKKPKYQALAKEMQENVFQLMLPAVIEGLQKEGFADVEFADDDVTIPEGALVIEGEFTKLNPGSRGKRYGIGFGAGKSQVCAAGKVLRGVGGDLLMEFDHCRHAAMGLFGGDSEAQMKNDSEGTGSHLAEFMGKWAEGKYQP